MGDRRRRQENIQLLAERKPTLNIQPPVKSRIGCPKHPRRLGARKIARCCRRVIGNDRKNANQFMNTKFPADPVRMKRQAGRFSKMHPLMAGVPGILVFECKVTLKAYYGSYLRAGLVLILDWAWMKLHGMYWGAVFRFCDWVGWTKLVPVSPDNPNVKWRHGGQCQYLNCSDMNCLERSVPRWFRKITGWDMDV